MPVLQVLLLSLAISIDGFGVGLVYGVRKIVIPAASLALIGFISAAALLVSMLTGQWLAGFLHPDAARRLGAVLLVLVGVWLAVQAGTDRLRDGAANGGPAPLLKIKVKSLGLIIQILNDPGCADVDHSGTISAKEAVALGAALAADAVGVGCGAAMAGFLPLSAPLYVGLGCSAFIYAGGSFGRKYGAHLGQNGFSFLPAGLMALLGIIKLCG